MSRALGLLTLFLHLTAISGLLCWWLMTEDQRREVLSWIGAAITLEGVAAPSIPAPPRPDQTPEIQQSTTASGHSERALQGLVATDHGS